MAAVSHDAKAPTGWQHSRHAVGDVLIQSRWITGDRFYVIGGLVAAAHVDELHRFVDRHVRSILTAVVAIGVATGGYYLITEAVIHNPGRPSDLYEPISMCGQLFFSS